MKRDFGVQTINTEPVCFVMRNKCVSIESNNATQNQKQKKRQDENQQQKHEDNMNEQNKKNKYIKHI